HSVRTLVFDIEADGLNPTKIHCLVAKDVDTQEIISCTDYNSMISVLRSAHTLVGHNIQRYDLPVIKRLLGIDLNVKAVDTLALSWYLYPNRIKHGLESFGKDFHRPKPVIDDWENLSIEEYVHRCTEDVEINFLLWKEQWSYLVDLYGNDKEANRLIVYLSFKLNCAAEQEEVSWRFDKDRCESLVKSLESERDNKISDLKKSMPAKV